MGLFRCKKINKINFWGVEKPSSVVAELGDKVQNFLPKWVSLGRPSLQPLTRWEVHCNKTWPWCPRQVSVHVFESSLLAHVGPLGKGSIPELTSRPMLLSFKIITRMKLVPSQQEKYAHSYFSFWIRNSIHIRIREQLWAPLLWIKYTYLAPFSDFTLYQIWIHIRALICSVDAFSPFSAEDANRASIPCLMSIERPQANLHEIRC